MRIAVIAFATVAFGAACVSAPTSGPMGEGSAVHPQIAVIDSATPPRHATVQLDQPGYVALLLVAPGHSATLLYPTDSITRLLFPRRDTTRFGRSRSGSARTVTPIPPEALTYLLIITSPQELEYGRIMEKTAGVSIPNIDTEALNAVGKAIKATIATEPRVWAGYYSRIEVRRNR